MPTSVKELFSSESLEAAGQVKWGTPISEKRSGVYVVATTSDFDNNTNVYGDNLPIDLEILKKWIDDISTLTVDGKRPTPEILSDRLTQFWLPDEPILYIGQTTKKLKKRIGEYYATQLGNRSPHAGGYWLKTLSISGDLNVFWATTSESMNPNDIETKLQRNFVKGVSPTSKSNLHDPKRPFPFANLVVTGCGRKSHGIDKPNRK